MLEAMLMLGGAAMFAGWLFWRKKAQATLQWPSSRGRVVAFEVYWVDAERTQNDVRVAYDYVVAGATLSGNRISLGGTGSGSIKAKTARYQPGTEVDVFYDPHKPASAVLERKLPGKVLLFPIMGVFLILVGVWVLVKG